MNLQEARAYHLRSVQAKHPGTPGKHPTEQLYATYWARYLAYLDDHGLGYDLAMLNPALVEDAMLWMRDHPTTLNSRRNGAQAIRMLVIVLKVASRFLTERHVYPTDPLASLRPPKVQQPHRAPFTEQDARAILAAVAEGSNPVRDRAVMLLLASTGCRVGELCGLEVPDVVDSQGQLTGQIVFRKTKNNRPRSVVVGRRDKASGGRVLQSLRLWLRLRRAQPGVQALFVTEDGYPLEVRRVQEFHRKYGLAAGVRDVIPHRWRGTHASEAFAEGLREEELRDRLGHISKDVLRVYLTMGDPGRGLAAEKADLAEKWRL